MEKPTIRIIFRKSVNYGDIFIDAIFIDSLPENRPDQLTCYSRVGQHSTCSIDWLYLDTRPAKLGEYGSLLTELKNIYSEYELKIIHRLPSRGSLRIDL